MFDLNIFILSGGENALSLFIVSTFRLIHFLSFQFYNIQSGAIYVKKNLAQTDKVVEQKLYQNYRVIC